MGKSWMGFHDPILQGQKSHPGPQRFPAAGAACLEVSASLAATAGFSRGPQSPSPRRGGRAHLTPPAPGALWCSASPGAQRGKEGAENGVTEVLFNRPLGANRSEMTLDDRCF